MGSWRGTDAITSQQGSVILNEYCHLKKTVYPFWQSIFHYKEWSDESDKKKIERRNKLKDRILCSLKFLPVSNMFMYKSPEKLKEELSTKFPFCKYHF